MGHLIYNWVTQTFPTFFVTSVAAKKLEKITGGQSGIIRAFKLLQSTSGEGLSPDRTTYSYLSHPTRLSHVRWTA